MTDAPDFMLMVKWFGAGASRGLLRDGTVIVVEPPDRVRVTLPAPTMAALFATIEADRAARAEKERRRKEAVAMCLADPKRSVASVAREMNLAASSLRAWVKAAKSA